jgi:hypothetical protein
MESNFTAFKTQLDAFKDKYYKNILFKGVLFSIGILTGVFLAVNFIEIFGFLSSGWRLFLLLLFIVSFIFSVFYWMVIPIIRLYDVGKSKGIFKRMTDREAAIMLSKKYPRLDDAFYNVLELNSSASATSSELLQAAIEQISRRFIFERFTNSIQYKNNRKYFKYVAIPIIILIAVFIFYPSQILKSSTRIIKYQTFFEKEFPFTISVENTNLETQYEEDFLLKINVSGEQLPAEISIEEGLTTDKGRIIRAKKINPNNFTYTFKSPQQKIYFKIIAGDYVSSEYILNIIPKPVIEEMSMYIDYPAYTGKKQEIVSNTFDASVPYGTRIIWSVTVKNSTNVFAGYMQSRDVSAAGSENSGEKYFPFNVNESGKPNYRFSTQITQSFHYQIVPYLSKRKTQDTLRFFIESIADAFPRISAEEFIDSNDNTKRFFAGSISDDYGFHSLLFFAVVSSENVVDKKIFVDTLDISTYKTDGGFTYFLDLNKYELYPGDELSYYFEVRDNDPFNGFKPANSGFYTYKKQSLEEIKEEVSSISENIEDKLSSTMNKMNLFKKEADKITQQLLEKKNIDWNDRKSLEDLINMQKSVANEYNQLSQEMQERSQKEQVLNELNEETLQAQKELQELFDKVFDKETIAKLEELQRLLDENKPKEQVLEQLDRMRENQQDIAKELERNLELYKQLEFEKNLEKAIQDLKNLREEQLALRDEEMMRKAGDSASTAAALETQREIGKKFEGLKKDLEKLDKLNKTLEDPNNFKNPLQKSETVKESLRKTEEAMRRNVEKKGSDKRSSEEAAENQQDAADQMQEMEEDLTDQQNEMEEKNAGEDAEFIRKLLKSVLRISFKQEALMRDLGNITVKDPRYAEIIRGQSSLKSEIQYVVDSINAIARRQPKVASFTSGEIRNILDHSRKSLERLLLMNDVRYRYYNEQNNAAMGEQQYTMTSLNNLSLMLEESLNKIDEKKRSAKNKKSKSKGTPSASCDDPGESGKKPKSGKKPGGSPKEMQEALNKQLDALKKMMEERQKGQQAGKQQGQQQKQGGQQQQGKEFSEQFGRAVMQQEMIRRALQEAMRNAKTDAATSALYNKILGDMERTERDLVNRTLTNETLMRQQQILTRLLEAESAELKREQEEKRESRAGQVFPVPALNSYEEFVRAQKQQKDVLRMGTPELKSYYKNKVDSYYHGE